MRFLSLSCFVAALALTVSARQKSVIVTYGANTPDDIMKKAMKAITDAGGMVTHEYKIIKGFSATAPEEILTSVSAWGTDYNAVVEEDGIVSAT